MHLEVRISVNPGVICSTIIIGRSLRLKICHRGCPGEPPSYRAPRPKIHEKEYPNACKGAE